MLDFQQSKLHHSIHTAIQGEVQYMVKERFPLWEAFARTLSNAEQEPRELGRFRTFTQACNACEIDAESQSSS